MIGQVFIPTENFESHGSQYIKDLKYTVRTQQLAQRVAEWVTQGKVILANKAQLLGTGQIT